MTIGIEVEDPGGLVYEAGGFGLHPRHPRYIGGVLGANPTNAGDALTNPIMLDSRIMLTHYSK